MRPDYVLWPTREAATMRTKMEFIQKSASVITNITVMMLGV